MKISDELSIRAYEAAKAVFRGTKDRASALRDLAKAGLDMGSAADYINNLRHMLRGEELHRTINLFATRHYLACIQSDFGLEALRLACASLRMHLDYYDRLGKGRQVQKRRILEEFEAILQSPRESDSQRLVEDIAQVRSQKGLRETEKQRLVDARVGQGEFRTAVVAIWRYCQVSGCREVGLLRASHIKPWRESNNEERLDPYNGLLLAPNFDAAFDGGFISFNADGSLLMSPKLQQADAASLGIKPDARVSFEPRHLPYLEYHRTHIFIR